MSETASPAPHPAAPPPPTPRRQRHMRRLLRALLWSVLGSVVLIIALLGSLWFWIGTDNSLATTVRQVSRWLPAGQQLQAQGVSGSIRHGGRIEQLQWNNETLEVNVRDIDIAWGLKPLLERRLYLSKVAIGSVEARATATSPDTGPTQPLEQLELPLNLHLPFAVQRIQWQPLEGKPIELGPLEGTYVYENKTHALDLTKLHLLDGVYQGKLALEGVAPMGLDAQLQGQLQWSLAEGQRSGQLSASAHIKGNLAGKDARLRVQAHAAPTDAPANSTEGLQADIDAMVAPWLPMPLVEAQANLRDVDAAAFWPTAPQTRISGAVQAAPAADGSWSLNTQLHNAVPGPADQQRIPLESISLQARMDEKGHWEIAPSQLQTGGGTLDLQGRFAPDTGALDANMTLAGIAPQRLWSTLEAAPLSGTLQAQGNAAGPIAFNADIQAPARIAGVAGNDPLHIRLLQADGTWSPEAIQVEQLRADVLGIQAEGRNLHWENATQRGQGQLQVQLPGTTLVLDGHIAPEAGQGKAHLQLKDLQRLPPWVQRLPLPQSIRDQSAAWKVQGQGDVQLEWQGGWQSAMRQLQQAGLMDAQLPAGSDAFSLKLQANLPKVDLTAPGSEPLRLREVQAKLQGQLRQATAELQGKVQTGTHHVQLQPLSIATRLGNASQWSLQLKSSALQYRDESVKHWSKPWEVQWPASLQVQLQPMQGRANAGWDIRLQPAQLALRGPEPGQIDVAWEGSRIQLPANARPRIQSKGQIRNLSTAWAKAFTANGKDPLAASGLSGVLQFDGQWDLNFQDRWQGQVRIARTAGDLRVQAGTASPSAAPTSIQAVTVQSAAGTHSKPEVVQRTTTGGIAAGIRTAALEVQLDGSDVQALLQWDSERAGKITANAGTQLSFANAASMPTLGSQAPLNGRVQAQLPDIGVWSTFAPPGWRIAGSFEADVQIAGQVQAPQWQGTLQSNGLAVRSILDGVDFKNGSLRAQLQGERLEITEMRLEGVRGAGLRIAGFSGNRTQAPTEGGHLNLTGIVDWSGRTNATPPAPDITMQMKAVLERLQVQVRSDRQISLSGDLTAQLQQGKWTVRGDITTDRAAILMPEASAPSLGKDVVVRTRAQKAAQEAAAQAPRSGEIQPTVAPGVPLDLQVRFDMGEDFAVQALGFTSRLRGELQIRNAMGAGIQPRVTGEITTEQGRYRAWGQSLDVENGLVRFNGPYDNPSLDILAIRPNIEVRAGVHVTGAASAPRVRLFSEPDLPDAEKLSWIALGRSTANGGAEAAVLQQAALAMLSGDGSSGGGNFAQSMGLDEIGVKGPADGEDASSTALTVGKRLSKDLYITYERSLSAAMGTLYIFYDLSKRLTLRGETGTTSAIDLIYTVKYD